MFSLSFSYWMRSNPLFEIERLINRIGFRWVKSSVTSPSHVFDLNYWSSLSSSPVFASLGSIALHIHHPVFYLQN
ncbi:hypothetical protein OPV22_018592 [Ensete ventricosum]|uniref:Uncharacterized protein n=1 Tax=Ensete ventricosum TaxID=4639 RepID=A0AAV8QUK1_ENSVE|nr:hypothetical protein OPV22_018592 [Ensete ventricosum]